MAGSSTEMSPYAPAPARVSHPRRRVDQRTALACTFCRQRKARCSGDWPQCKSCKGRNRECVYPGQVPSSSIHRHRTPVEEAASDPDYRLPSHQLRRTAIAFFRDNYAKSLLCFLPPQQLVEDPAGEQLPLPLLLCIIALTARFLPEFSNSGIPVNHHVDWARREVDRLPPNQPSSITTVQCCLILCVIEVGEGLELQAWLRLGHATRLAQLARLHKLDREKTSFDWAEPGHPLSAVDLEVCRRTFWCTFCLDRLLANGRDRIATLCVADITTHLPQSDEDFIFGRHRRTGRLTDLLFDDDDGDVDDGSGLHQHHPAFGPPSLFSCTVHIIEILGDIVLWHGRSGRRQDARCPWLPDMPFSHHSKALARWRERLPRQWDHESHSISRVVAAGQGKMWSLMFLLYFQAKTYLYREYLPFTPSKSYDPTIGPSDGPPLVPTDCPPPPGWWRDYTVTMVESANSVASLYEQMHGLDLAPSAFPFIGLCLFTAASIHAMFTVVQLDSLTPLMSRASARQHLSISMRGFNSLGQYWDLAIHWIRQISLYYKLNYLTNLPGASEPFNMNIQDIKDGVMNYLRELSPKDRSSTRLNLKPTFDFDGWVAAIESTSSHSLGGGGGSSSDEQPTPQQPPPPPPPPAPAQYNNSDTARLNNDVGMDETNSWHGTTTTDHHDVPSDPSSSQQYDGGVEDQTPGRVERIESVGGGPVDNTNLFPTGMFWNPDEWDDLGCWELDHFWGSSSSSSSVPIPGRRTSALFQPQMPG